MALSETRSRITVLGTGYLGATHAICMAVLGHEVLGIDSDIRNGFSGIKVTYDIDADATPEEIKALVAQSQKRSAVFDALTNPTDVTVEVA